MEIIEKYSHLNGEEYLIVHHNDIYKEIVDVIHILNADKFRTKVSKEKTMKGRLLYNPDDLNLWRHYGVGKIEFAKPAFN
ncbi:MAG: hypothetical protein KAT65_00080 [Methanophagales archaeon]|nr:hypothetical protein [Methanophagales archaeon]